jgi:sulfotransferase
MTETQNDSQQKKLHYIAGLPRSGSTLLSSLLNQNPRFYSGPSSPVVGTMMQIQQSLVNNELYTAYPKPLQATELVASVASHYYSDVTKPVVFDKNRSWTNNLGMITGFINDNPKILCPVRDVSEILTSFITMHRRNPYEVNGKINFIDEMLVKSNIPLTDDNRCEFLAGPNGILGQSYTGMQQLVMEGKQRFMHFIEYSDLMTRPEETMQAIYDYLEEPYFEHDFENIQNIHREDDARIYGLADMHEVRAKLEKTSVAPELVLSPAVLQSCENAEFWRNLAPYSSEEVSETATGSGVNAGFFQTASTPAEPTNLIGG